MNAPPRIHVLAKPTGAACNLACAYCFFLDKELLYPDSHFRMSDEVLEAYIRQLIEAHRTNEVTAGVILWLAALNPEPLRIVQRSSLGEALGHERMFFTLEQAVETFQARQM